MSKQQLTQEEKKDLNRLFRRQFMLQAASNSIKGQASGIAYTLIPFIERWYAGDEKGKIEALQRANEYINTNGTAASFLIGLLYSLEKQKAERKDIDGQVITNVKASLGGPLAAIGDPLFYLTTLTIADGIAIGFMAEGNPIGLLIFLLIFMGVNIGVKYPLIKAGYTAGSGFIKDLFDRGLVSMVTDAARVMGLTMLGALSASLIKPSVTLVLTFGESTLAIQDILDKILPKGLSLAALFISVYLLKKKKVTVMKLVIIILVFSILMSFLGIM